MKSCRTLQHEKATTIISKIENSTKLQLWMVGNTMTPQTRAGLTLNFSPRHTRQLGENRDASEPPVPSLHPLERICSVFHDKGQRFVQNSVHGHSQLTVSHHG